MTTKSIWSVCRFGRGTMLLLLLAGSIGFNVVDFLAFKQLNLMINIGFRFDALPNYSHVPLWRTAAEIAFDILLLIIAIGRLHDIGRSGWWLSSRLFLDVRPRRIICCIGVSRRAGCAGSRCRLRRWRSSMRSCSNSD